MNATVLGDVTMRNWGDGVDLHVKPREVTPQVREEQFGGIMHREHNYLVISGGGAKGAYGAGVLNAWSELGTRPEFTVVTGISTGALTAPFAFLGSDYDAALKEIYTTLDTRRIIDTRNIFAIIGGDSISDSSPLKRLIEELIDEEMVAGIAREYHRGRQLLVGTTHLDAGRPMVWNITRMAASEHPDAIGLIRQVLLASASIPGAFPPVYIEVETPDGRKYDEMHVDGGTSSQMFFYPASINWGDVTDVLDVRGTPTIYIIRNAFIQPKFKTTQPRLLPIANRTISSLIRTQGIGDFFKIATLAGRDGLDLEVTWIPDEANEIVRVESSEDFDPVYMAELFEYGYKRTLEDETWLNYYEWIKKY